MGLDEVPDTTGLRMVLKRVLLEIIFLLSFLHSLPLSDKLVVHSLQVRGGKHLSLSRDKPERFLGNCLYSIVKAEERQERLGRRDMQQRAQAGIMLELLR